MKLIPDVEITITKKKLRKIVAEELSLFREGVDHEGVKVVVTEASKLLKALTQFKDGASGQMINATTPAVDQLIKVLENMVSSPASYVDKPKPTVKTVKLRKVDDDE